MTGVSYSYAPQPPPGEDEFAQVSRPEKPAGMLYVILTSIASVAVQRIAWQTACVRVDAKFPQGHRSMVIFGVVLSV